MSKEPIPAYNPVSDPFADLWRLKRWVQLGVYATIAGNLVLYVFAIGLDGAQLLVVGSTVLLLAVGAIEGSFKQSLKLRKRIVYPNLLATELGPAESPEIAAASALAVLEYFFRTRFSFIVLLGEWESTRLLAARGVDEGVTTEICERTRSQMMRVAETHCPALHEGAGLGVSQAVPKHLAFIPLVALNRAVGVAVLAADTRRRSLGDGQLLVAIGKAVGMPLENLRQKQDLEAGQARTKALLSAIPDAMVRLDREGTVLDYKPLETASGTSIVATNVYERLPEPLSRQVRPVISEVIATGVPSTLEFELLRDGRPVHREARIVKCGPNEAMAIVRDVTERRAAEAALRESEERFRKVFEDAPMGIALVTPDLKKTVANGALCEMLGYSEEEMRRISPYDVTHPDDVAADAALAEQLLAGLIPSYKLEKRYIRKGGETIWTELTATVIRSQEGNIVYGVGMVQDITARRRAEETVQRLAFHDALTGLPNRALLKDRLSMALARAHREQSQVGVMFLDLDRFKLINDTLGHTVGDELLQSVGDQLLKLVREADTVARVGGDEFTLVLPAVAGTNDVVRAARRILNAISQPRILAGSEIRVTASLGIAVYPADGHDAESLLRNADTAMYRAKEGGRDGFELYNRSMNIEGVERLSLETSIGHGLERSEFIVHYQPQVDLKTLRIVGLEALVRWQHPERGLISPAEFIPVAEETGQIVTMGEQVLRMACGQAREWQAAGRRPLRLAVNLSARQFQQRDLLEQVRCILAEFRLAPQLLQVEITEGVAMRDADFTAATLKRLRDMGVEIAIDDFGTGHSSLGYLKAFPINAVKIDRSFIRDLTEDASDAAIARAIIALAHSLSLKVIAEGVETPEQLAFLKEAGCDEFQGYIFSHPLPPEALEAVLEESRPSRRNGRAKRGVPELTDAKAGALGLTTTKAGAPDFSTTKAGAPDFTTTKAGAPDFTTTKAGAPDFTTTKDAPDFTTTKARLQSGRQAGRVASKAQSSSDVTSS